MAEPDVVVIDYGMGNLLSVRRALEHCGAKVTVTSDPNIVAQFSHVVLPGVGAFASGMAELKSRSLEAAIGEAVDRGRPLLGICLGMQMLLDESDEFGLSPGLGLIPGRVVAIPSADAEGRSQKVPHIGWGALALPRARQSWANTMLHNIEPGDAAYFVHSFMACPSDADNIVAECAYGSAAISAVIGKDNVFGCQFHPEKSGQVGLNVLRGFLAL